MAQAYRGRFAPSPTGALHAGSLVAALASWLDARAHGGTWLVRIEDTDTPRCPQGTDRLILGQLSALGLHPDEPPVWQAPRAPLYQQALDTLTRQARAFPCACSRGDVLATLAAQGRIPGPHQELVYPGTCRQGLHGRPARAWRLNTAQQAEVRWTDRRLGAQRQHVEQAVGDFILKRADGLWSYQLAVVVDDAAQGISDVVRGEDLADNTPRQILLQQALGLPRPRYLHTPLVLAADGQKLSKQTGAQPLDTRQPLPALNAAARVLGLPAAPLDANIDPSDALATWTAAWAGRHAIARP